MIIGIIYNFWPVQTEDESEEFEACNTWHWKIFGWLFEVITFLRSITADIMKIEALPFVIKVKDK